MHFDPVYTILTVAIMGASRFVSMMLQKRFAELSQVPLPYSGADVAKRMLADADLNEVEITATQGQLTDHYNPMNKTVNLSEVVYGANSVAAAAVAAHECGHAIQHKNSYPFLKFRSSIVPLVKLSSKANQILLMIGLGMAASGLGAKILLAGIALFGITTLFAVITLPVEFNASKRALQWMETSGITQGENHKKAKKALFWAAMTYTVGALGQLGQLFYFISIYMKSQARRA